MVSADAGTLSPQISAIEVAARRTAFDELTSHHGRLFWVESSASGGRRLVAWPAPAGRELPSPPVDSALHAYGGGLYAVDTDQVWAVDETTGQVMSGGGLPLAPGAGCDGDVAAGDGRVLFIRDSGASDALLVVDQSARTDAGALVEAAFLGSPCAAAGRVAWTQWSADSMPWDACQVWTGLLGPDGVLTDRRLVAGGLEESAVQPQWGPDGGLYFMSDRSGWWNLYRFADGTIEPVAPIDAECARANWEAGYRTYTFLPDGRIGMLVQQGLRHWLAVVEGGVLRFLATPYSSFKPYLATFGDRLAVIGSSPTSTQQVALVPTDSALSVQVVAEANDPESATDLTVPYEIQVDTAGGVVSALVYRPQTPAPAPTIVRVHPGPTHHSEQRLDWEVQYFTSRGFVVVDVDYRGSTGYGRQFRTALNHQWGVADVDDCQAVARQLAADGVALPGAMFITGASAGGFTALRAVCRPDTPFALAAVRSAIVDPDRWRHTAPRFQRAHARTLASPGVVVDAAAVCRPVLLAHGQDDPIAPVADARTLAANLRALGRQVDLTIFTGVGHYISGDALVRTLGQELAAFRVVVNTPDGRPARPAT